MKLFAQRLTVASLLLAAPVVLTAAPVALNSFSNGEVALAAEVNANFAAIQQHLETPSDNTVRMNTGAGHSGFVRLFANVDAGAGPAFVANPGAGTVTVLEAGWYAITFSDAAANGAAANNGNFAITRNSAGFSAAGNLEHFTFVGGAQYYKTISTVTFCNANDVLRGVVSFDNGPRVASSDTFFRVTKIGG